MFTITISDLLRNKHLNIALGIIQADVVVCPGNEKLSEVMDQICSKLHKELIIEDIARLKPIHDSRQAYKKAGKEPSRYRLSSEALLRRIVQGKGIYKINNIVDIGNLVSIRSYYSLGMYDSEQIKGDILFTIGNSDEQYSGISRGNLNIDGLPVFSDSFGSFSSPTSDSERVKVTEKTKKILMNIISFSGEGELPEYIEYSVSLLSEYASAENIGTTIIR